MLRKRLEEKKNAFESKFLNDFTERFEWQFNEYQINVKRLREIRKELKNLFDEFSLYIEEKNVRQLIEAYKEEPEVVEHNTIREQAQESIKKLYELWDEYKNKMNEKLPGKCDEVIVYLRTRIAKIIANISENEDRNIPATKKEEAKEITKTNIQMNNLEIENKAKSFLDTITQSTNLSDELVQKFIKFTYEEQYQVFKLFAKIKKYENIKQLFMVHFSINMYSNDTLGFKFLNEKKSFTKAKKVSKILARMCNQKTVVQEEKTIDNNKEQWNKNTNEKNTDIMETNEENKPTNGQGAFWWKEWVFNIIKNEENTEKNQETESTLPIIFTSAQEIRNIPGLWTGITLPNFNTIEEMEDNEEIITKNIEKDIAFLESSTPEIDFKKLSINEITKMKEYIQEIEKMEPMEIFNIIKEYMWSIQYTGLSDDIKKKMDRRRTRGKLKEDYIRWPSMNDIEKIAKYTLEWLNKKHNIDIIKYKWFKSDFESPITTLLVFLKIKKDINPERTKKISEALIVPFHDLINRHTKFALKLMFDKEWNKNARGKKEFFWEAKNEELKMDLRVLRSIMYNTVMTNSITPRQQNLIMQISEKYKETIKIAFMADQEGSYAHMMKNELERKKGNVEMACQEIMEKFDDWTTNRKTYKITINKSFPTVVEIINSIYVKEQTTITKSMADLMKTGLMLHHLKEFISWYLQSTKKEREEKKAQKMAEFTKEHNYLSPIIVESFFNSIDQYV